LFAGCGGLGKSVATLDLTAAVTTGHQAFGLSYAAPPPADVLLCFAEDDAADTVVPRLLAGGADLQRVHEVRGLRSRDGKPLPFSLADCDILATELKRRPEVRLVVIDPVGVFAGRTGIDTHKEAPVQALLANLRDLALEYRVAIVLVAHVNKNEEQKARNRVSGSAAFVNSARAAFLFTDDPSDESGRRLVLPVKFNCGREPPGLMYTTRNLNDEELSWLVPALAHLDEIRRQQLLAQLFRLDWCGLTSATADEVLARKKTVKKDAELAAEWLASFLADRPVQSSECVERGNEAQRLNKPLKWWRDSGLKELLKGKPRKTGFGDGQCWWFTLPCHPWPFFGLFDPEESEESEEGEGGEESRDMKEVLFAEKMAEKRPMPSQYPSPSSDSSDSSQPDKHVVESESDPEAEAERRAIEDEGL